MGEVFGPEAERLVVPVTTFIAPGVIEDVIAGLETNLESLRHKLAASMPAIMDRARSNFILMAPLFHPQTRPATH
jgi:hypothetical protein